MLGLLKALIMPSNFAILCIVSGLALLFFQHLRKPGVILLATGGTIITLFSTGPVASLLLSPLEYEFPTLSHPEEPSEVRKIVVLTHYVVDDPLMPLSSRVSSSAAYRVLETHNLYLACLECDIIVSGVSDATRIMKQLLVSMAVPEDKITLDVAAHTYISAENLKPLINEAPFYLVTSAGHMPRSMRVFRKQAMHPVPAPTDFQMPRDFLKASLAPSPQHLYWSDLAVAEYAGIIWYKLQGRL